MLAALLQIAGLCILAIGIGIAFGIGAGIAIGGLGLIAYGITEELN